MKEAIEKAKKNNFNEDDYRDCIYQLIFGTNFIECVLEGRERICQENKQNCDADINEQCIGFQTPEFQNTCEYRITADYHRQQMAKKEVCMDVEKLKDYVRGLV
jgi:hypothetical protein